MTDPTSVAATAPRHVRLPWRPASVVTTRHETPTVRTLALDVHDWDGHRPGQHVDIRLTAEDGYQAQRSYSIASAPRRTVLELTVEYIPDGEVSPWLVGEARTGDRFELRGPIGGYFVWDAQTDGAAQLIAGGSGVVPLLSMVRHRAAVAATTPMRLLYSARSLEDVIGRAEVEALAQRDAGFTVTYTLTRVQPPGWRGHARRVDRALLAEALWGPDQDPLTYVCGPTRFVETVATLMVDLGHRPDQIRTERFGPTGMP